MGSSVIGADAGIAYSNWTQTAVISGRVFSVHISGNDTNYGTVAGAVQSVAQNNLLWARRVLVTLDPAGGSIRYRYDGAASENSPLFSGHVLTAGDSLAVVGWENIRRFQFASTQVVAGILNITAER